MMNDIYKRIQVRAMAAIQNTSTSTTNANDLLPKVKDWCRSRYDRILRAFPWSELVSKYNLSLVSGTTDYSLRYNVHDIIKMWDTTNGVEIVQQELTQYVRFTQPTLEVAGNIQTGPPEKYIDIGTKSCSALMSVADQVQVLSSSASDVTPLIVRISGEVGGLAISESLTLTGVTAVTSTNTYDLNAELTISIGTSDGSLLDSVGIITVREKTTPANIIAKAEPEDRAPLFKWIRITPQPNAAAIANIWFKKRWKPLNNDNDVPLIECANEIVEGIVADALWEDGQDNQAMAQEKKWMEAVGGLWISRRPKNLIKQFVPDNSDTQFATGFDRYFYA